MNILQKTLHSKTIQQPTSTLFPYTTLFRSRKRSKRFSPPKTSGHPIQPPMTENPARIMSGRTIGRGDSWMCFTTCSSARQYPMNVRKNSRNRSEEHTSELQSHSDLVCRLL